MADYVLRIEGVNLGTSVFNTNDLSTLRGASLALEMTTEILELPQLLPAAVSRIATSGVCRKIYSGGSQAAFTITRCTVDEIEDIADELRLWLRTSNWPEPEYPQYPEGDPNNIATEELPPTDHLCFCVDWAEIDVNEAGGDQHEAEKRAVDLAMVKSRFRQMRMPSVPPAKKLDPEGLERATGINPVGLRPAQFLCPADPMRPVSADTTKALWVREGQFGDPIVLDARGKSQRILFSDRAGDLRPYGRSARQRLYRSRFQPFGKFTDDIFAFSESFEDIIADPPAVPVSARGKMAVFYLDGASFGDLRARNDLYQFSAFVRSLFIEHMLYSVVRHMHVGATHRDAAIAARYRRIRPDYTNYPGDGEPEERPFIRYETLLLGGEDWCFVAPSWLVSELLERVFAAFDDCIAAQPEDFKGLDKAGLRAGVLICPSKTPISRARELAHDLCESARGVMDATGCKSAIDIQVMESVDVPYGALAAQRNKQFAWQAPDPHDKETTIMRHEPQAAFGFAGNDWGRISAQYRNWRNFPRSQLYRMIRETHTLGDEDEKALNKAFECLRHSEAASAQFSSLHAQLPGNGRFAFRLKRLSELWDYVVEQPPASAIHGGAGEDGR